MPPPWIVHEQLAARTLAQKMVSADGVTRTGPRHQAPKLDGKLDSVNPSLQQLKQKPQHDLVEAKAFPMGDFRYNDQARARKLEALMGTVPKQERREFENPPAKPSERPPTKHDEWEVVRKRAVAVSSEHASIAMKRDGAAWVDEDGYTQAKEPPAFRDGFNNVLRVKPPPEEHLHNGKELPQRMAPAPAVVAPVLRGDQIQQITRRADITAVIGEYFVKAISSELSASKPRDVSAASYFRKEHQTSALEGGAAEGVATKAYDAPELDGERVQGEIQLLLRALETVEAPAGYLKESSGIEKGFRQEQQVSRALGNAFVSLGMTLPAGPRDDPLRNDSVALQMGTRIMSFAEGGKTAPKIEDGLRKEVAIALGRAMLHLRAAANIQASRGTSIVDKEQKDRTLKRAIGKLTLQLLESTAARSGKTITKDPLRREVLAKALGAAVAQLEAASGRQHVTDRGKTELGVKVPVHITGPVVATKSTPILRMNKPHEVIVKRPMLPGREAPPPHVPRYVKVVPKL